MFRMVLESNHCHHGIENHVSNAVSSAAGYLPKLLFLFDYPKRFDSGQAAGPKKFKRNLLFYPLAIEPLIYRLG